MTFAKKIWRGVLRDPFSWLLASVFRPTLFTKTFERHPEHLMLHLRLFLPIFMVSYPITLVSFELSFPLMLLMRSLNPLVPAWSFGIFSGVSACLIALVTTSLGIGAGLWLGEGLGLIWSIVTGIVGGIILGVALEVSWIFALSSHLDFERGLLAGALTAVTGGILGCMAGAVAGYIGLNMWLGIKSGIIGGLVGGVAGGALGGISLGIIAGMALGILTGILGGMGRGILASKGRRLLIIDLHSRIALRYVRRRWQDMMVGCIAGTELGVQIGIPVGILGGLLMRFLSGIATQLPLFSLQEKGAGLAWGIAINPWSGFAWGSLMGLVAGIACGIWLGIAMGSAEGLGWGLALCIASCLATLISSLACLASMGMLTGGIAWGISLGVLTLFTFILCYPIGCYRWPLYPFSAFSCLKAYLKSQKNPQKIFNYLKHSSIHWDECRYPLPLPGLDRLLMCAVEQDSDEALREMVFISDKRPSQIVATQAPTHEIAIRTLEKCGDLRQIAAVSKHLIALKTIRLEWVTPFATINNVSEMAALYLIGRQQNTLKEMRENLEKNFPHPVLEDKKLEERLNGVVKNWRDIIQLEEVHYPQGIVQFDNPYCPGLVLRETNSPFVGRRDLVRTLEAGLRRGRQRLPLMLWGERRMGKSSTLQQLPFLLENPLYIPVFYDLQSIPATSSTPALLFTIADEIQNTLYARNIQVEPLRFERLNEAKRENEAVVYRVFEQWLKNIERLLEKQGCTLLLLFDEFEKLMEVAEGQYLDLRLLLNWFRYVVQHNSQIALLFSGLQSIGKMPPTARIRWADYFVNFQTYKVSFLRPDEARLLITYPVAHFSTEHIFSENVVEDIMHVTGCHPFLVQAVCSTFIDHLNITRRGKAERDDIVAVIDQVLERYGDTYFLEQWSRTSQVQQNCMLTLYRLGETSLHKVAQSCMLDESVVGAAFLELLDRDLIVHDEQRRYRLAIPLFSHWLRNRIDYSQF